jgi:glycosyltransferase involved in cell wall biosynthesis
MSGALVGEADVRLIDMPFARGSFGLLQLWRERRSVVDLMHRERPDIVHAIALRPIALSLLAGRGQSRRVFAVTGRGYLAALQTPASRLILAMLAAGLRHSVTRGDILLVENADDRHWVEGGVFLPDESVVLMPGAGVDPSLFQAAPEPPPPIVVGVVARLVWSKGVDVAVDAVSRLRALGLNVELRIAGAPDPENPDHLTDDVLARWAQTPGVSMLGRVTDIAGFWSGAHIACSPSRGGEGLPRSLLEAAACGRPFVTSDTPGCRDFAQEGGGLVVQAGDANALANALHSLMGDAAVRQRLGARARQAVLARYTEEHAADCAVAAWRRALRGP